MWHRAHLSNICVPSQTLGCDTSFISSKKCCNHCSWSLPAKWQTQPVLPKNRDLSLCTVIPVPAPQLCLSTVTSSHKKIFSYFLSGIKHSLGNLLRLLILFQGVQGCECFINTVALLNGNIWFAVRFQGWFFFLLHFPAVLTQVRRQSGTCETEVSKHLKSWDILWNSWILEN